jgi:hypothetical protein
MHQQLSYVLCQAVNFGQVPTVPGAEETGCHANARMVLFFFCIAHGSMVFQDWYDSVSRGLLSRHLLSTVEEFSDHSQVARRCEK